MFGAYLNLSTPSLCLVSELMLGKSFLSIGGSEQSIILVKSVIFPQSFRDKCLPRRVPDIREIFWSYIHQLSWVQEHFCTVQEFLVHLFRVYLYFKEKVRILLLESKTIHRDLGLGRIIHNEESYAKWK